MAYKKQSFSVGFTIVELLVVIIVIGILAAITIVAYTGISQKATIASITSDLDNASKQLKLDQVVNSNYPATLALANGGKGIPASPGTTYQYVVNNSITPQGFCITATNNSTSYKITNDIAPVAGDCANYGLVLQLDAGNSLSYPGSGTTWTDLSGNNNNGTLMNGVGYASSNGGILTFDGVDDYVNAGNATSLDIKGSGTISMWVDPITIRGGLFSRSDGGGWQNERLVLHFYGTGGKLGLALANGTTFHQYTSNTIVPLGQWIHLVVNYDGTNVKFYFNGVLDATVAQGYTPEMTGIKTWIGKVEGLSPNLFTGSMGDVRIYNRALSADEISQIFNALRGRYGI